MQFTEENKVLIKHYRFTKEYGRTPFKLTNVQRLTRENEKKKEFCQFRKRLFYR